MVSADFSGANTSQQDQFQAIKVTWLSMDLGSHQREPLLAHACPGDTHMCLVLFQRCDGHALQEKMEVGIKERPPGNANRRPVRLSESSKSE